MEQQALLQDLYNPEKFKELGHKLVDVLTQHLKDATASAKPTIKHKEPNEQFDYWDTYKSDRENPLQLFEDIIDNSIHLHNPKYIGHQVGATAPISALADLMNALLNNGMAVYEMGETSSTLERIIMNVFKEHIGYASNADGFLTSGGTLATLTSILAARKIKAPSNVWEEGNKEQLAIMVSEQAHYCVERATRIMGFGNKGVIKVPVNDKFIMDTSLLPALLAKAKEEGKTVIAVVGSAPSTSTGMHDDLESIANFCEKENLWFHVDGAHGGAAVFSKKYKLLLKGIEKADSVVIDLHKMLLTSNLASVVLFKNEMHGYATFNQEASYLWEESEDPEWFNLAKRTFECSKNMMATRFFVLWKLYGTTVFEAFVNQVYDASKVFAILLENTPNFELALQPETNIICFRYTQEKLSLAELNTLNKTIRRKLLEKGDFYIVQTELKGITYLRCTVMNAFTNEAIFKELLSEIKAIASTL